MDPISADEALARLRRGNARHVADQPKCAVLGTHALRRECAVEQHPFAVVLGCADSRAPAEIVFDQNVGDLFVIRVAGHVVGRAELGSIEMAAEEFGVHLVVVLGHTCCGAIGATLNHIRHPEARLSPNLMALVDHIRPSVLPVLEQVGDASEAEITEAAVRANIRGAVRALQSRSPVLARLVDEGRLRIVAAEYDLESGAVEFMTNSSP